MPEVKLKVTVERAKELMAEIGRQVGIATASGAGFVGD